MRSASRSELIRLVRLGTAPFQTGPGEYLVNRIGVDVMVLQHFLYLLVSFEEQPTHSLMLQRVCFLHILVVGGESFLVAGRLRGTRE